MIQIKKANKYYNRSRANELHVLNDVDLTVPERGMVAIFGKSGCGKTTLLNAIGGLDRIDSGEITVLGEDMRTDADRVRNRHIGYIFQNYNLSKNETVYENVAAALRLCGMTDEDEIRRRVSAALDDVGMGHYAGRRPDALSGGQQQRVAIARALVKGPAVILADEPTGNLDETNTVMVMDILKEISKTRPVLLVTHEAELVAHYCDRVIEIVDGRIVSERENAAAEGHSVRDKNDVYLGEMPLRRGDAVGVSVLRYGEGAEEIKLRLIHHEGVTYLTCDTPGVTILDHASELRLHEGVYTEAQKTEKKAGQSITSFAPVTGGVLGRLFTLRSSILSGYRAYFSGRRKKTSMLLRVTLVLLSLCLVLMSSYFAVGLRDYGDIRKNHADNIFYLPLDKDTNGGALAESIGKNGISAALVVGSDPYDAAERFQFRPANFVTAALGSVDVSCHVMDRRLIEGMTPVVGTLEMTTPYDAVITTAMAEDIIKNSTAEFVDEYADVLSMVSVNEYVAGDHVRIVGVVDSHEKNMYLDSMTLVRSVFNRQYGAQFNVIPASRTNGRYTVSPGEAVLVTSWTDEKMAGTEVTFLGRPFTVREVITGYASPGDYPMYVEKVYGEKLLDYDGYCEAYQKSDEPRPVLNEEQLLFSWLLEYYPRYLKEFITTESAMMQLDYEHWVYAYLGNMFPYITCYLPYIEVEVDGFSVSYPIGSCEIYCAMLYKETYGVYPTVEELLDGFMTDDRRRAHAELEADAWNHYEEYHNSEYAYKNTSGIQYVVSDEDYLTFAYAVGDCTHGTVGWQFSDTNDFFYTYNFGEGTHYLHHMQIVAYDVEEAEQYLSRVYGDLLITPDAVLAESMAASRQEIMVSVIAFLAVIALICLCIYFMMRSSVMHRVKEIGVYRAIGVSRKNLVFRFAVETLVLITLSAFVGYLIAAVAIAHLASVSVISSVLYFPWWMALGLLVLLYGASVLFGILPVVILTHKTPSAILAKYDI